MMHVQYYYSASAVTFFLVSWVQCVILLSQIKVNSMAIVRLNFLDVNGKEESAILSSAGNALTSTVEQVCT